MASISLKNIDKRWGDVTVIKDLNLDIHDGEFMVLLGPSGCGKTTTMRMIAGLETPSTGDVMIDDKRVNDDHPRDRDIAMVFQNYGLYPQKTVYGNIAFPLTMKKIAKDDIDRRVRQAAKRVELDNLLDRKPAALSGGQRQRVALARAIVREPALFLMDEPLSNLDAKLRVTMRALLKHLHHEFKRTTVYVTHDQIEAMTLADRVALINQGKIQQLGTPEAMYSDPDNLFVAGFIGSPAMNFIKGKVEQGVFVSHHCRVDGFADLNQDDVTLGIRPEDIHVCQDNETAHLQGQIYSVEMTGESTLITVEIDEHLVVARADKQFRAEIGEPIRFAFDTQHTYLFDSHSEQRIRL